jgi:EAL domain-containing protein (putative c-di-GMP-specific phosphodiesterase class I)
MLAQPILDLHTGEVRQHELLLRMLDQHDDLIPPAAFLYIAERFGLTLPSRALLSACQGRIEAEQVPEPRTQSGSPGA